VQKDYIRRTDINDNHDVIELQRQCTYCELINDKSTFTKHKKQDTHWAACNSEIAHHEYICDENSLKQKCKSCDDKSANKELCTESVITRKS